MAKLVTPYRKQKKRKPNINLQEDNNKNFRICKKICFVYFSQFHTYHIKVGYMVSLSTYAEGQFILRGRLGILNSSKK